MTKKIEYKKDFKQFYLPKTAPEIIDVPKMPFIMIEGEGNPNGEAFGLAVEALFSMSYAVKMSYKGKDMPEGYYEYTVFPLEGIWDLIDITKPPTDKENLKYTMMIRQPDFLTAELFARFVEQTAKKKPHPNLHKLTFGEITDGLSCQMMHIGSFDDEQESFAQMEAFCKDKGYTRLSKTHREIYLSDPRRVESAKLKTVLRFLVSQT